MPEPGARVRVPFGERALTGVVLAHEGEDTLGLREIVGVLDVEPVCPPELLAAVERVARRSFASTGEVLKTALPARLPAAGTVRYRITERGALSRPGGAEGEILERLREGAAVALSDLPVAGRQEALRSLEERGFLRAVSAARERKPRSEIAYAPGAGTPEERARSLKGSRRGKEILAYLEALGRPAVAAEIRMQTGAGPSVLRNLLARGALRSFEQARKPEEPPPPPAARPNFRLTAEQENALAQIRDAIAARRYFPALLQGVTGSGKTEVYLRAISSALAAGRAAVLHSAQSERERAQEWDRVRAGEARAVIGPRSAAFAPVADPGLFVVDEEHDGSYKQRESPRYDARDVAAIRALAAGAALLFGSATPSMEAYQAARDGRLHLLRLTARVDDRPLPEVTLVDLKRENARPEEKGVPLFSGALVARLNAVFSRGEQAILLQPRRGFAPFLLCRQCGYDFRCSRCSVSRTVHEKGRVLICHYCGERIPKPLRCSDCGGAILEAIGAGTERVAERFAELFPGVSSVVLDRDSARRRGAGAVLDDMISGRASCLIGTQMVAKGHDFPGVTAVGVLSADTLLNFPDFRAAEKTFQLVAQVAGRAGRGDAAGTVHVQTFHPQHPAIRRAAGHDVDGFAAEELAFRRSFFYPPFAQLASVLISSPDREKAQDTAKSIGESLAAESADLRISGPAPAPLERLQGRWRFQILIRAAQRLAVLDALESSIPDRPPSGVQIAVDVDPQDLM